MTKPIFNGRTVFKLWQKSYDRVVPGDCDSNDALAIELSAHLSSLGIDAETPEKLKRLEAENAVLRDKLQSAFLTNQSQEARVQFAEMRQDQIEKRLAELERQLEHAANTGASIAQRNIELERMIAEAEESVQKYSGSPFAYRMVLMNRDKQLAKLREMIAGAQIMRGRLTKDGQFIEHCVHSIIYEHSVTHRARLIQIEEIK